MSELATDGTLASVTQLAIICKHNTNPVKSFQDARIYSSVSSSVEKFDLQDSFRMFIESNSSLALEFAVWSLKLGVWSLEF